MTRTANTVLGIWIVTVLLSLAMWGAIIGVAAIIVKLWW
jgi:hypothetical protein